jgi:hypothetical protein
MKRRPRAKNSGLHADRVVLRNSRGMQNKVDTFCIFQTLSSKQKSISGNFSESGRISAR